MRTGEYDLGMLDWFATSQEAAEIVAGKSSRGIVLRTYFLIEMWEFPASRSCNHAE